jgi:hypothetical protein
MRREQMEKVKDIRSTAPGITMKIFMCFLLLVTCHLMLVSDGSTAVSDRVIAFVDNDAITMSELDEQYKVTAKISPDITTREVLDTMINKILILREARKYRIEASSLEQVMQEYIDLKVRAFIRVSESDIEKFYQENMANFSGKEFEDVRDEIDKYLTEKELNERLKELLKELRRDAYIRIFIEK